MATVNRGWLKRQVMQGRVMARCTGHYTDDYAFDAAYGFGIMDEWKPVRIAAAGTEFSPDFVTLTEWDFTTKSGGAYTDAREGVIQFYVHSNLSYDMKVKTS